MEADRSEEWSTGKPRAYAQEHRDQFLDALRQFVRIPSISTLPEHHGDLTRAAEWTVRRLSEIGLAARIMPSETHPAVYAEWTGAPGRPSLPIRSTCGPRPRSSPRSAGTTSTGAAPPTTRGSC